MLKKLLGSRTRINILKLFIFNPKKDYYVREIERLIKEPFDPVRRELIQLESIGLLKSRVSGRQKYYCANTGHMLFPEFKSMIMKTVGIGDTVQLQPTKLENFITTCNARELCDVYILDFNKKPLKLLPAKVAEQLND